MRPGPCAAMSGLPAVLAAALLDADPAPPALPPANASRTSRKSHRRSACLNQSDISDARLACRRHRVTRVTPVPAPAFEELQAEQILHALKQ